MGNRGVLLLGVVGLALVAAGWFAAGSPSRTTNESTIPAQIVVTATQTGTGTWVRYLIDVRNVGDVPFDGDAVLLNRQPDQPTTTGGVPTVPPPQVPTTIPHFPASAPDAAYQVPIHLEPRQERTFSVVAPDRYSEVAIAQEPDGTYVPNTAVAVDHRAYVPVAVLTQSDVVAAGIQGLRLDDTSLRATAYTDAKLFPSSALGLAGFTAIVIDQFDTRSLSPAQVQAIRDFVGQGGGLVVAGGDSWRRTLSALPPELSPLHATAATSDSLTPIAALGQSSASLIATIATGDLRAGARPAVSGAAGPLLVEGLYGSGTVVDLAFDPAAAPAGSDILRLGWTESVGRVLLHAQGTGPATASLPAISSLEAQTFPPLHQAGLPSPWLVLPLLLAYLVMVAPVNYFLLRKRRRQDLLWVTAPLVAVLFTSGFYWLGADLQGGVQDEQLQVLKLGPNGSVAELDYHRVVFMRRGAHTLDTVTPALAAPLTFDLSGVSTACGERCSLELAGLPSGEEHVIPAQHPVVLEKGVVYGGVRVLGTVTEGRQPLSVEAHLGLAGGKVVGEIVNTGHTTVHGIALYSLQNGSFHRTPLVSVIPPGGHAMVEGTPQPFDGDPNAPIPGTKAPPDAATRISRAVGTDVLARTSAPWLVGFTDPLPDALRVDGTPATSAAIAVFEMPVRMEAVDSSPGDWAVRRLASTSGDRARGGLTDVYDIELPGRLPSRMTFGYDSFLYSSVDVFDWSTNSWTAKGFIDDPTISGRRLRPVAAGDLLSGDGGWNLLRVRVGEPRINWGSSLYVLAA